MTSKINNSNILENYELYTLITIITDASFAVSSIVNKEYRYSENMVKSWDARDEFLKALSNWTTTIRVVQDEKQEEASK